MKQQIPVYLNIYNFMTINNFLEYLGIGAYHTAIELKGIQLCYLVCDKQSQKSGVIAMEPESAGFPFNRKIYLGQLNIDGNQLQNIIDQLAKKYTCGKYHLFKFNCNHFSNELSIKLLGKSIPQWVFRSTNILKNICCCLPVGLVSGQWALERYIEMEEQQKKKLSQTYNKQ